MGGNQLRPGGIFVLSAIFICKNENDLQENNYTELRIKRVLISHCDYNNKLYLEYQMFYTRRDFMLLFKI